MDAKALAQEIAEGAIVMLKNEGGLLPLPKGKRAAIFGRAQWETIISGNGSGATWAHAEPILAACERNGLVPAAALADFYRAIPSQEQAGGPDWSNMAEMAKLVHSGAIYEYFGQYRPTPPEPDLPQTLLAKAAQETDTGIIVLGRRAGGEECDRRLKDDYCLSEAEKGLIDRVCAAFPHVALVLNINGLIDLGWLHDYPTIQSVLFIGVPGEMGAPALARILMGDVAPSGRLAATIPKRYEDMPWAGDFSYDREQGVRTYADYGLDAAANGSRGFAISPVTVYREGIYMGCRYFDAFHVAPLFPFGFGLGYTTFEWTDVQAAKEQGGLTVRASVTNTGCRAGRDVVELYIASTGTDCPARTLQGFHKTALLQPGETETITLHMPWRALAHYDEESAAWVIPSGIHQALLGRDCQRTETAAYIGVERRLVMEQCRNRLGLNPANRGRLDLLHNTPNGTGIPPEANPSAAMLRLKQEDVAKGRFTAADKAQEQALPDLSTFTAEELAALCVGYGSGVPFSAFGDSEAPNTIPGKDGHPLTTNDHPTGLNGYVSPAMPARGIHSVSYADGPAGVGLTAWPSEMLLACCFDKELCRRFGDAVGAECEARGADIWLAPAVNLLRHPLCGRSFEYFSEDPYLTGELACAISEGVQRNHPVLVCPKHMAANEQETLRRGSARLFADAVDSIVSERALREMYLLPFEMLVRKARIHCVMTSFNKMNGVFAAASGELCTQLLREEWGFDGAVVTDWGDMDTVADGADAVAAGNDIVMPGGPPVIHQILKGYENGRVSRKALETAARHMLVMLRYCGRLDTVDCGVFS